MQAHLRSNVRKPAHPEVGAAHPVLDRAEDVLDRSAPDPHRLGHPVEPVLHRLDDLLVLPSRDAALVAGRAVRLQPALPAIPRPIAV